MWIVGFVSAFGIKFSSSVDDVMWLAPFLTSRSSRTMQMQNSVIYITVCLLQTLVAMAIAYSAEGVAFLVGKGQNAWSTEKMLTVGAGILLACYSVKLTYEYIQELNEGDEGEEAKTEEVNVENGAPEVEMTANKEMTESNDTEKLEQAALLKQESFIRREKARQRHLFVIAFIGSVDDLTLFVPMLVGRSFDIAQLMLGAFFAAMTIVTICVFIGLCKPVADLIAKIPLALIVAVFAVALLVKGFMSK